MKDEWSRVANFQLWVCLARLIDGGGSGRLFCISRLQFFSLIRITYCTPGFVDDFPECCV